MNDNRNLIIAVVLSLTIFMGYEYFLSVKYPKPLPGSQDFTESTIPGTPPVAPGPAVSSNLPGVPSSSSPVPATSVPAARSAPVVPGPAGTKDGYVTTKSRTATLEQSPRVMIASDLVRGSISLTGGRIDDLTLTTYRTTLDEDSPNIDLLTPEGLQGAYFAQYGWAAAGGIKVPDAETLWSADRATVTPQSPVTLTWDNGEGLIFSRVIALNTDYMFTITQQVTNTGDNSAQLSPWGLIARHGTPEVTPLFILHEGPIGVFDGTLKEIDYDDLHDEKKSIDQTTTGGWIGITDKFWLTALVPDQKIPVNTRFSHNVSGNLNKYQVDFVGNQISLPSGGTISSQSRLFTGAKEVSLLDRYMDEEGISRFDLAIDFGWFYYVTKPIFYTLIYLEEKLGNFGLAILALTVLIKLVFFPLANKSYKSMSKMKKLQPEMKKLQERFGDDKMRLNQEMMALYKKEGANPVSGCLPMLVQIPIFFSLYKVLFVTIEMRQAPFYGWIADLSAPDPTSLWNFFGLIPWDPSLYLPAIINIGAWPLVMGITMFLQQKLNPQPNDPMQAKIMMFLPLMFTFMLAQFPAGLVIYWAWNNTLSILQQWVIMRRMGVKI